MANSLYSTWRARRRDVAPQPAAAAATRHAPLYDAIARLGVGLAGIACGGDAPVSRAK